MKEIIYEEAKGWKLYLVQDEEVGDLLKDNYICFPKFISPTAGITVFGENTFLPQGVEDFADMKRVEENAKNAIRAFKKNPPDFNSSSIFDDEGNLLCGILQVTGGIVCVIPKDMLNPDEESPNVGISMVARQILMNEIESETIKGYIVPENINLK